jgi:hypothetical protein
MFHWHGPVDDARPKEVPRVSIRNIRSPVSVSRSQLLQKAIAYAAFGCLVGICGAAALDYISAYLGIAAGVVLLIGALIRWGFHVLDCEILH